MQKREEFIRVRVDLLNRNKRWIHYCEMRFICLILLNYLMIALFPSCWRKANDINKIRLDADPPKIIHPKYCFIKAKCPSS
jgi:hypothetical protein